VGLWEEEWREHGGHSHGETRERGGSQELHLRKGDEGRAGIGYTCLSRDLSISFGQGASRLLAWAGSDRREGREMGGKKGRKMLAEPDRTGADALEGGRLPRRGSDPKTCCATEKEEG